MVEILIFLMKVKDDGLTDFIRSIDPLELDPALSSEYLQFLLKKRTNYTSSIMEEVEARYEELDHPGEREKIMEAIKDPDTTFQMPDEDNQDETLDLQSTQSSPLPP
jgi:hypothetical protein